MRHQKGKLSGFIPLLKRIFFSDEKKLFKVCSNHYLRLYCEALDCCVAIKLSMNEPNGDCFCSFVEDESTDWAVEVPLSLLAEIEHATSIVSPWTAWLQADVSPKAIFLNLESRSMLTASE